MVRSTARILTLLEILQSGGTRTVAELADRLEVDKRTVRRYVDQLRDLDVPVDSVRGRYGGYRLASHYRMPPLMLTDEEALAVTWALLVAGSSGSGPVPTSSVDSAAAKVRRIMPPLLRRRIEAVLEAVDLADPRDRVQRTSRDGGDAQVLFELSEAARDQRPVSFDYTPRYGGEARREVHPYGVVAHRGSIYLTAFDVLRQASRTFRLDRIARVRRLDGTFGDPGRVEPLHQVMGPLPPGPDRVEVSVLVEADCDTVWAHIPRIFAAVSPLPDYRAGEEWVRIFLRVERLEWVAQRLAVIDRPFVVEYPPELAITVRALAQRLSIASARTPDPDIGQGRRPGAPAPMDG